MKQGYWKSAVWVCLALSVSVGREHAQTRVHLNTQGKAADFGAFEMGVRPWRAGVEMPESCQEGEAYFRTDLPAGHNLFVCVTGNTWKATSYDPGIGIVLAGNTIQVEDAVIPSYRTGHGTPSGNCSPGRDFYVDLDSGDLHFCSAENSWRSLKQGPHTHAAAELTSGILAVNRGGTGVSTADVNSVLIGDGTSWSKSVIPNCSDSSTGKLLYSQSSRTFTCGADQLGGGGGTSTTEALWLFVGSSSYSATYPNIWTIPATTSASVSRLGTSPHQWVALLYGDTAEQRASTVFALHPLYQSGMAITIHWYANANTTASVVWTAQLGCTVPGAAMPAGELAATTATTAHNGVSGGLNRTTIALPATGCAGGDVATLRLIRDGANAADDLAANAAVVGVQVRYVRGL